MHRGLFSTAGLLMAGACALAPPAYADNNHRGRQSLGNGRGNINSFLVDSPTFSHDLQHQRNANIGGITISPQAICKKRLHCKILQKIVLLDPIGRI